MNCDDFGWDVFKINITALIEVLARLRSTARATATFINIITTRLHYLLSSMGRRCQRKSKDRKKKTKKVSIWWWRRWRESFGFLGWSPWKETLARGSPLNMEDNPYLHCHVLARQDTASTQPSLNILYGVERKDKPFTGGSMIPDKCSLVRKCQSGLRSWGVANLAFSSMVQ